MKVRSSMRMRTLGALMLSVVAVPATAEIIVVQCTIDSYRSSYAPRPESFIIQVDLEAGTITTYYGTLRLKQARRALRGVGAITEGWRSSVSIDRNSGRFEAGTDRIERGKYSYVALKGSCILPPELRGQGYRSLAG